MFGYSITSLVKVRFLRFLVVGGINTGFSYLIYAFCLFIGMQYAIANFMALVLGIFFSFKTQGSFVFYNTENRLLGRFVISWAIIYLITITIIGQLVGKGLDAYTAGALALPFSAILSYVTQKHFVFRPT